MMLQPTTTPEQAIAADNLVKRPDLADAYYGYLLITDTSTMGTYANLSKALNMLDARGWKVVSMVTEGARIVVLLYRDKQKRNADEAVDQNKHD